MSDLLQKYAELYEDLPVLKSVGEDHASAFLLSGEDADGLATLAKIVAAKLCGISSEQVFGGHTDIIVYPKPPEEKKPSKSKAKSSADKQKRYTISADDIREIVDSLYLTPFELEKRVFILENAESMSEICQNKLLKSLEEPPPRVCFILCAGGRMLPTVESRCNRIELPPFSVDTVERALGKYHRDARAVALAARASRGNPGLAERILADPDFADMYAAAKKILKLATGSKAFARTAAVYEKFTRDKTESVLGITEYLLSDIARIRAGAETVFEKADITDISGGFTAYSAAVCCDFVREARKHNAANCMPQAVMDTLILKIMQERAKA